MDVLDIGKAGFAKLAKQSHDSFLDLVKESDGIFQNVKAQSDKQLSEPRKTSSAGASSSSIPPSSPTPPWRNPSPAPTPPPASAASRLPSPPPATSAPPPAPAAASSSAPQTPPPESFAEPWHPSSSAASSSGTKRKSNYTYEQVLDLRAEEAAARDMGVRWQDRGPPREHHDSDTWRGQKRRESSGRWANRGGAAKAWYAAFYKAKGQGAEALSKFLAHNPKPAKT